MALEFLVVDSNDRKRKLIRLSEIIESCERGFDTDRTKLAYLKALLNLEECLKSQRYYVDAQKIDEMTMFWTKSINRIPDRFSVRVKNFGNIEISTTTSPVWGPGSGWDPQYEGDTFSHFTLRNENGRIAEIVFDDCWGANAIVSILYRVPEGKGSIYSSSNLDFYIMILEFVNVLWEKSLKSPKEYGSSELCVRRYIDNKLK